MFLVEARPSTCLQLQQQHHDSSNTDDRNNNKTTAAAGTATALPALPLRNLDCWTPVTKATKSTGSNSSRNISSTAGNIASTVQDVIDNQPFIVRICDAAKNISSHKTTKYTLYPDNHDLCKHRHHCHRLTQVRSMTVSITLKPGLLVHLHP